MPQQDATIVARTIALSIQRLAQEPHAADQIKPTINEQIATLQGIANADSVLLATIDQEGSYVTLCSAAYGLYLVDPSQVDAAVDALVRQMNRMAFADQGLAQQLVVAIGEPAVPTLARHLSNSPVVNVLAMMGPAAHRAVLPLTEILGARNVEAAVALLSIGTDESIAAAAPVLANEAEDPNSPYAKSAVIALGTLGSTGNDFVPSVRIALEHVDPDTRVYAATALADLGDTKTAVEALTDLLGDHSLHTRYIAIQKLGDLGPIAQPAIPALISMVQDTSDQRYGDRALAARAVTEIDPDNAEYGVALATAKNQPELFEILLELGLVTEE